MLTPLPPHWQTFTPDDWAAYGNQLEADMLSELDDLVKGWVDHLGDVEDRSGLNFFRAVTGIPTLLRKKARILERQVAAYAPNRAARRGRHK